MAKRVLMPHKPKSCVCLGRPHYTGVNKETARLCQEFGIPVTAELLAGEYRHRFADAVLKAFGIERLDHMDVFSEEGEEYRRKIVAAVSGRPVCRSVCLSATTASISRMAL